MIDHEQLARECGTAWAEQGPRSEPAGWRFVGLTPDDIRHVAGPSDAADELDIDELDAFAREAFYASLGQPRTLAEARAALIGAEDDDVTWSWAEGLDLGGDAPHRSESPVWAWDTSHVLVGPRDAPRVLSRGEHARQVLSSAPDMHERGLEPAWADLFRHGGEPPAGAGALFAPTHPAAIAIGWTGAYATALRGLIQALGLRNAWGKASTKAAGRMLGVTGRSVRYWTVGEGNKNSRPIPWASWTALRTMLPRARPQYPHHSVDPRLGLHGVILDEGQTPAPIREVGGHRAIEPGAVVVIGRPKGGG